MIDAFLFGLVVAASIGPIALLIVGTSIGEGLRAGLACGLGAAVADLTLALVAFGGVTRRCARRRPRDRPCGWRAPAFSSCSAAETVAGALRTGAPARPARSGFAGTFLLTLANPLTLALFAAYLASRGGAEGAAPAPALAAAAFAGSLVVQVTLASAGAALRPWLSRPRVRVATSVASGVAIAAFGVRALLGA